MYHGNTTVDETYGTSPSMDTFTAVCSPEHRAALLEWLTTQAMSWNRRVFEDDSPTWTTCHGFDSARVLELGIVCVDFDDMAFYITDVGTAALDVLNGILDGTVRGIAA
ncbi:MAG: hypothetical protein E6R06_33450 [Mycobacterium sp.]|jgi:hypothetical protein|nr:MAG: hypothetical protein E6R06_33450 [Mycobacterium sp.]